MISKKKLSEYLARIHKENEKLKNASPADKRVLIALDVLAQIKMKRIVPTSGRYLLLETKLKQDICKSTELQTVLSGTTQCDACALGSIFVSMVDRFNKFQMNDIWEGLYQFGDKKDFAKGSEIEIDADPEDMTSYLQNMFSAEQLGMIEAAFEGIFCAFRDPDTTKGRLAREFCRNIPPYSPEGAGNRLQVIMENIVINNGTFLPKEERTWKVKVTKTGKEKLFTPGFDEAKEKFLKKMEL